MPMSKDFKRISLIFLCVGFFCFFLIAPQIAIASFSISGDVIVTDVGYDSFYVVWEADIDKAVTSYEASIIVYDNQEGDSVVSGCNPQELKMFDNGVMAVKVSSIPAQLGGSPPGCYTPTTYYYRIKVIEDGDTGNPHYYPALSESDLSSFSVMTQGYMTGAAPSNPPVKFKVYKSDEGGNRVTLSATDGACVCLEVAGASYPVFGGGTPGGSTNGFAFVISGSPFSEVATVALGSGTLRDSSTKGYLTISGGEQMTVRCLGADLGSASITISSFTAGNICQAEFDTAGDCETCGTTFQKFNVVQLAQNMPPQISPFQYGGDVKLVGTKYGLREGQSFILNVHGDDPDEGESIQSWTLTGDVPSGMTKTIITDPTDIQITWTPGAGDVEQEYTVSVNAINDKTGSRSFTAFVTDGVPSAPDSVVITTTTPQTDDDLSCTITGGSDPLGDPITYNYRWYNDLNITESVGDTTDTVITLDDSFTTKGETWNCEVTVTDDIPNNDGTSGPTTSAGVEILNTPAVGSITVAISPSDPTRASSLSAAVTMVGCSDADDDTLASRFYWYKIVGGTEYSANSTTLSETVKKNETWYCKAIVTEDGTDTAIEGEDSKTIGNTAPTMSTGDVSISQDAGGLHCSVDTEASDPDEDPDGVDTIQYYYEWICETDATKNVPPQGPTTDLIHTHSSNLLKNQDWHCEVWAWDGTAASSIVSTGTEDISNSICSQPEANLRSAGAYPDPNEAYLGSDLVCSITAESTDPDTGDQIIYTYQWLKNGADVWRDANSSSLTSTYNLPSDVSEQGKEYTCEVTPSDGQNNGPACITNIVTIGNRAPTITVWKGSVVIGDEEMVQVTETEELVLTIVSDDADNNTLSSLDADANIPTVAVNGGAVIQIVGDPNEAEFTWTPAQGDAGTYEVVFKVQETDGPDSLETTHSVQIKVIYPSKVIDNFEFQSDPDPDWYLSTNDEEDMELRTDHGWSVLTGSGDIYRRSYENDPDNHYLNMVSNESDPLKYITTLWLADPNETKDFYEVRCDIDTNSPYTVEAYVHVVDTVSGAEKDYFLRYIPEDPSQHSGNEFEVDAMRINYYIGSGFIDPNGCPLERNMENDIHNAIAASGKQYQSHYDYVWGFILRGEIDKFDNLEVVYGERDTVSPKPPETGSAVGIDEAVVLTWEDDPNQDADVLGYEIAWVKDSQTDTQNFYVWETGITGELKSCKILFEANSDSNFPFTIKAFDDAKEPNYSSAIGPFYARPHEDTNPPDMATCNFTAQAPKTQGETINLEWTDPGVANLSYFKLYMDEVQIATPDKTVLTYQVTGLVNDTEYEFRLEGYNGDHHGGLNSREVTGIPMAPKVLVFDDFEYVAQSQTPMQHGWKVLQGSGNMAAVEEDGNSCMHMTANYTSTAKTNFIITKFVDSPEDYTNTKLYFNLKGLVGEFKIDLFISDTNGNRYFLRYSPNATYNEPKPDPCKVGMYITHYLDWRNNDGPPWHPVVRDLQKDLQDGVPGATFGSFLGMVIRGEVFIDDIIFMRAMPEVGNLVAISGNTLVDLAWTRTDPNVDVFYLSVDGAADVNIDTLTHSLPSDGNQCSCTVDSLTNDTTYSFTVKQGNSSGVTVSATPHDFVFEEDCNASNDWTDQGSALGSYSIAVDPETHDNVLVIDPGDTAASRNLIRYYVGLTGGIPTVGTAGKSEVAVNIKSDQDFVLWFTVQDTSGVEYNLLYASGQGTDSAFGTWSFSYLPSCGDGDWTDGSWHTVDLELNDNLWLQGYSAQVYQITNVSIGGCDDVSVDNLSVY